MVLFVNKNVDWKCDSLCCYKFDLYSQQSPQMGYAVRL